MRLLLSLPPSLAISCALLAAAVYPQIAAAQTVETNDYIYIGVEAEDYVNKDDRWVITSPSTPTEENDPDGNHSDQAGGSTYLELLPDVRVTHEDTFGPPLAYWGQGGQGPGADYPLNFPEPGRYYVHIRAYSTGTEDNGIHVGLNGNWPASGQRMQFCTAHLTSWQWGSNQRDSGGNGSCGIKKSIWVDVPSAGMHTFSISAREDGFEIDKIALIKDLSDNTRVCSPTTLTGVNCVNGSIESADDFVDLRVILSAEAVDADPDVDPPNPTEVEQGYNIQLTAKIENLDAFDTAHNIVLTLSPVQGNWRMLDMDQRCIEMGDEFECTLDELEPTAPNENAPFSFTMQALVQGDLRIDAALRSDDFDDSPANDVAKTDVRVLPATVQVYEETDLELTLNTDKNQYQSGDMVQLSVEILNLGQNYADNVLLSLTPPAGLYVDVQSLPTECTFVEELLCGFGTINSSSAKNIDIGFIVSDDGVHTLSASVRTSSGDYNSFNDQDAKSINVETDMVDSTTAAQTEDGGSTDDVDTTGGTTAGGTDSTDAGGSDDTSAGTTDDSGTTAGETAGAVDGQGTDDTAGQTTSASSQDDSDSGALTHWFVLALILLYLTRLYGRHQRELVAIDK